MPGIRGEIWHHYRLWTGSGLYTAFPEPSYLSLVIKQVK